MKVIIRKATDEDCFKTEYITRESFWNVYKMGCDEHLILKNLRNSKCYVSNLDLVAVYKNEIIGHIISTKARVIDSENNEHEVLCVGPLSVLPEFQKQGVGSILMKSSIAKAKELNYAGMIIFGNPDYYHRFGFINAKEYKITTKDNQNFEPFMALEIMINGLSNVKGRFFEDSAFEVNQDELTEFEKKFPYKEKFKTSTQFE